MTFKVQGMVLGLVWLRYPFWVREANIDQLKPIFASNIRLLGTRFVSKTREFAEFSKFRGGGGGRARIGVEIAEHLNTCKYL